MSTVTLACPRCSQAHCIDLGASGDFSIDRQGQLVTCPSCKKEFRARTTLTQTVHEQLDACADQLFHAAFHADPAAEAIAQAEYRRLAHTGAAIVLDPRD
jgi:hypothetical protein